MMATVQVLGSVYEVCILFLGAGCDEGFHTYCVNVDAIPLEDWFCPDCSGSPAEPTATPQRQSARLRSALLPDRRARSSSPGPGGRGRSAAAVRRSLRLRSGGGAEGRPPRAQVASEQDVVDLTATSSAVVPRRRIRRLHRG